ncbi:uncharacterized protein LOC111137035 [Crassostrea virginica]
MSMLEFLQENSMLWDIKLTDFRRTDKKNKIWDEQSKRLGKTPEYLKGWFKSLRDIYTRLDKKKSGDGAPDLTEREQWIKDNFSFMKAATRHRPEPVNSVKAVIDAHRGNLHAAEAACEDLADTDADNSTPFQARSNRSVLNDKKFKEEDILQSLQKRINVMPTYTAEFRQQNSDHCHQFLVRRHRFWTKTTISLTSKQSLTCLRKPFRNKPMNHIILIIDSYLV